jgi:O-antigen/teichoic acid export membrane protein
VTQRHDREVGPSGRSSEVDDIARGSLAYLLGTAASMVSTLLLVVLVSRSASASTAGVFFGITSIFLMAELASRWGTDVSAVYFVSRWRATGEAHLIRPGLRAAMGPLLALAVAGAVAVAVSAPWLTRQVSGDASASGRQLQLLALLIPLVVAYHLLLAVIRGLGRMRENVVLEKVARPLLQVLLVALVLAADEPGWLLAAWGLPYLAVAAAAFTSARRLTGELPRGNASGTVRRSFWRFAFTRAPAGAAQIVMQRLDIVLVAAYRGPRDAAIYTAATRFLVVGQFVLQSMDAPLQPRLSAAVARFDQATARRLYAMSTTWTVLVGWPVFALAAVMSSGYLGLFGSGYRTSEASTVVIILAVVMAAATVVGAVDSVIIMSGRAWWSLVITVAAVGVNVVLNIALIPRFGMIGAAIAWGVAIVGARGTALAFAWRVLGLHPFGRRVLAAVVLSAVFFVVLPLVAQLLAGTVVAWFVTAAAAAVYAGTVWHLRAEFALDALRLRGSPS